MNVKKIIALMMSCSLIGITFLPFVNTTIVDAAYVKTNEKVTVSDIDDDNKVTVTTTIAGEDTVQTTTTAIAENVSYPYIKPYELTIWCQNTDDYTPIPDMEIDITIIRTSYNDKPEIVSVTESKDTINTQGKEKVIYTTNLDFTNRNENYTFVLEPKLPDGYRRPSDVTLATQLYAFQVENKAATGTIQINTTKKPKETSEALHLEGLATTTTTSTVTSTTSVTTTSVSSDIVKYPYIKPYELTIWCQNTDDYTPIPDMDIDITIIRTTYNDKPEIVNVEEKKETINTHGKAKVIYSTNLEFTNLNENYTFVLEPKFPDGYRLPNDITLATQLYAFQVENKAATGTIQINTTKKPKETGEPLHLENLTTHTTTMTTTTTTTTTNLYIPVPEAGFNVKSGDIVVKSGSSVDVTLWVSQIRSMSFTSDNPNITVDPISEPELKNNAYNTITVKCAEDAVPGKAKLIVRYANYLSGVEHEEVIDVTILGENETLPQTGNNSLVTVGIAATALVFTLTGAYAIAKSGRLRKKEDE